MPNGGVDNCGECEFATRLEDCVTRCEIRDTETAHRYWTYCANNPRNNPQRIRTPIGPIYEDAGDYPYRRTILKPSEPDNVEEKLRLLDRLVRGDLDSSNRIFQVELVKDIGEARTRDAIPMLVELAVNGRGDLSLVTEFDPNQESFDLGDARETRAARTEFLRLASLRALRRMWHDDPGSRVLDELARHRDSASPEQRVWINVADVFITAYEEPP